MIILLAAFLALAQSAPSQQPPQQPPQPRPNPCDAAEFRQFDFWIGEWTVKGPQGAQLGTNRIEQFAGNCGLQENWTAAAGGTGKSLNTYQRSDGKWHQVWVGMGGGGVLHLAGGLRGKAMVLEGTSPGPNGTTLMNRVTWTLREDGSVRQFWETSADQGATWTPAFDGYYSKVPRAN